MNKGYRVEGFKDRLRNVVADSDMTIVEISRKSGISRSVLWSYMVAGNNPSVYSLKRLALTLNVSADWLLGIEERRKA